MSDFLKLPDKVDDMILKLNELASQLKTKENKVPPKKLLNIDEAVECLVKEGYLISKSTLYKKTSSGSIPYKKFGNRILFDRQQILEWCKEKITTMENKNPLINLTKKTVKNAK